MYKGRQGRRAFSQPATPEEHDDPKLALLNQSRLEARSELSGLARQNSLLVSEFRSLGPKALLLRSERDSLNSKANALRRRKTEVYEKLKELHLRLGEDYEKTVGLRAELPMPSGRLHVMIERLEWTLQTEALSPRDEKALSKRIRELRGQLPAARKVQDVSEDARDVRVQIGKLRAELEGLKPELSQVIAEADGRHSQLRALYEKADALRKKISENNALLGEKREGLGEADRQFFNTLDEMKREEASVRKAAQEKATAEKANALEKLRTQAASIREKMAAGKKLSMEEFQVLQELEKS